MLNHENNYDICQGREKEFIPALFCIIVSGLNLFIKVQGKFQSVKLQEYCVLPGLAEQGFGQTLIWGTI